MRIRWKLLVLLLISALVPLGVAIWIGQNTTGRLGGELAAAARERLIRDAKRTLLQTVRDHGKLLRRGAETLEHNVRLEAHTAERCLSQKPAANPEVHYTYEFETDSRPPWLSFSENYSRIAPDGLKSLFPISYEYQSVLIPGSVPSADVAEDIARLSAMKPLFQLVYQSQADFLHWEYVALESGVHCCYPGHGYYPEAFDPRQRIWYINARLSGKLTWNPPIVDASTQQVILTISMPIYREPRVFAGVVGLDVRMTDLVKEVELPEEWAAVARNMLIVPADEKTDAERGIYVIAEHDYQAASTWDVPVAPPKLASSDGAQLDDIYEDIRAEQPGVREMPYEGSDCLWAYGPLTGTGAALLAIVPREHIIAPAIAAETQVLLRVRQQRHLMIAVIGGVCFVVLILALVFSRHLTKPVRELAAAAHRIAAGDLETPVHISTHDELGELGETVNQMLPSLRERIRLKHALALAMEVQQHLLPAKSPLIDGLDVAGCSLYCDETGGDYYDFLDFTQVGSHALGVAVGDVTGHGIAAALLMTTARSLLRGHVEDNDDLGELLNHMNRHLASDVPDGSFMTFVYLRIDSKTRSVRWVNAGHDPAVVYDPASDAFDELGDGGIPLGIDSQWKYKQSAPRQLQPEQVVVVGTDGIWEARNSNREMFGKERFRQVLRSHAGDSSMAIRDAITSAVADFRGAEPQNDDVTLVVVKIV